MLEKHNIQKVLCRQSLRPVLWSFERYTLQTSCGLPVLPDWSRSLSWLISLFKAKCPAALLTIWSLKTTQNTKLGVNKNIVGYFANFPAMLWERSCTERKDLGWSLQLKGYVTFCNPRQCEKMWFLLFFCDVQNSHFYRCRNSKANILQKSLTFLCLLAISIGRTF